MLTLSCEPLYDKPLGNVHVLIAKNHARQGLVRDFLEHHVQRQVGASESLDQGCGTTVPVIYDLVPIIWRQEDKVSGSDSMRLIEKSSLADPTHKLCFV